MATEFGAGNMSDVAGFGKHPCTAQHTGKVGVLLYGTWGATGNVRPKFGGPDSIHYVWILNKQGAATAKSDMVWTEVGLYIVEGYFSDIKLQLDSGEDGVTNINYKLYLMPRP